MSHRLIKLFVLRNLIFHIKRLISPSILSFLSIYIKNLLIIDLLTFLHHFNVIRQKRGLVCPLKNVYSMYKYSYYASWIASNTAAPLLTSYGKDVALSSNVML